MYEANHDPRSLLAGEATLVRKNDKKLHLVLKLGAQQQFAVITCTARILVLSVVDKRS